MFANARQGLHSRRPNRENNAARPNQTNKPNRPNNGALGSSQPNVTFIQNIQPAEQKFTIFCDSDLEVRKPERGGAEADRKHAVEDKENLRDPVGKKLDGGKGARPRVGLAVRHTTEELAENVPPPKPARRNKDKANRQKTKDKDDLSNTQSPKKSGSSAETTPADYLVSEQENRSSTCGISSQMKGIELSSAGGPLKKPAVQVPFGELDISGSRKPAPRRPTIDVEDREDDKENVFDATELLAAADELSPPSPEQSESVDGLPTNCFAIARPSLDKAHVSLHKLQEDEMCRLKEYSADIFAYLRQEEKFYRPKPMYMSHQPDLASHMRCMLVDWLVEVAMEYKLSDSCLFMAVSYIDRFLSFNKIMRSKLQLLGTTAMFIAAKVEEIYPPESEEFVFITDNTYTKEQLLKMETFILMALDFRMTCVTPYTFYSKFIMDCDVPETVGHLALYLLELAMMEGGEILNYLPSVQAASAVALACHSLMVGHAWKPEFRGTTGYTFGDLMPCMSTMKLIWAKAPTHDQQAVRQKYLETKTKMVANTPVCLTFPQDVSE